MKPGHIETSKTTCVDEVHSQPTVVPGRAILREYDTLDVNAISVRNLNISFGDLVYVRPRFVGI